MPYTGEIRLFALPFIPNGWAACDGKLLEVKQHQALFSLLGAAFGGDGHTTFALPDLRGRTILGAGALHPLADDGGEASHALTADEIPDHTHTVNASSTDGNVPVPGGNVLARTTNQIYREADGSATLRSGSIANAGASAPHENRQPYLTMLACIALDAVHPQPPKPG